MCTHLLWGGCKHSSWHTSDPCSGHFQSQVSARASHTATILWKHISQHHPGCCLQQGWFPSLTLYSSPRGTASWLGSCRRVTDPPRHEHPPANSPGHDISPLLVGSSSFSLWDWDSTGWGLAQRCSMWQEGKEGRVKDEKRVNKKCITVTMLDGMVLPQIFTPFHLPVW